MLINALFCINYDKRYPAFCRALQAGIIKNGDGRLRLRTANVISIVLQALKNVDIAGHKLQWPIV
jgi:hypothetical protein